MVIDGIRYRVVYAERGDWIRTDGKPDVRGVGFVGVIREGRA